MATYSFVIWADNQSADAYHIEALSYEGEAKNIQRPPIAAGDFVIIDDAHQEWQWFGQVIEPQRNLALQGLTRDNPSNIAAMERVLSGDVESSVFLRQVYYYRIRLLGEVVNNRLTSVKRRPRAGSRGRVADYMEVIRYMDLPPRHKDYYAETTIGKLHGTDRIPIAIDDKRLYYHVLVAGATGGGKSNTVGNLIQAAQAYNMCTIIFDHKPDYQNVDEPNDEENLFLKFRSLELTPQSLSHTTFFSLYNPDDDKYRDNEIRISIQASDVPLGMLSAALFYKSGEEYQQESFEKLINDFADRNEGWTIEDFQNWERNLSDKQRANIFSGESPHKSVIDAMRRRLSTRVPTWMDAFRKENNSIQNDEVFGNDSHKMDSDLPSYFIPQKYLRAGHIIVIRVNTNGREYGLFLSYMLRQIYDLRRRKAIQFPILNIIDEAQDIFQAEREVKETAATTIQEILRKGRSKQVGFVFAVQSAGQLPITILNNLNSRIIHRQNADEEIRDAIPGAPRELLRSALTFGAGEALVSIYGSRGIVHAEMAPSPFMLTKDIPESFGTLSDQMNSNQEDVETSDENFDGYWSDEQIQDGHTYYDDEQSHYEDQHVYYDDEQNYDPDDIPF